MAEQVTETWVQQLVASSRLIDLAKVYVAKLTNLLIAQTCVQLEQEFPPGLTVVALSNNKNLFALM